MSIYYFFYETTLNWSTFAKILQSIDWHKDIYISPVKLNPEATDQGTITEYTV